MRIFPDYDKAGRFQCYRFDSGKIGNAVILSDDDRKHNFTERDTSYMFIEQSGQKYLLMKSEHSMWHGAAISSKVYEYLKELDFEKIAEYYYTSLL